LLSWNENGREFYKGFKLWTSLLKAWASGKKNGLNAIGVRFTLFSLRSVRRHSGKQGKWIYLSKIGYPSQTRL
jgi:hypothetical protein